MVFGCFDRDAKLELQKEKASKKADGKTDAAYKKP